MTTDTPGPAAEEHTHEGTTGDPNEVINATTAFLVYLDEEGHWRVAGDLTVGIRVSRPPTLPDFTMACATISKDVIIGETVSHVMGILQQQAQQAQQALQRTQQPPLTPQERAAVSRLLLKR